MHFLSKKQFYNPVAIKIIFLFWSFVFSAVSGEVSSDPLLENMENGPSEPISCEELADGFCRSFWSSENQGNFQFSDGTQILYGDRRKNVYSNTRFIHNQKLAKSRCNLPEDIKDIMGIHCGEEDKKEDLLSKLDTLLSQIDSIENNKKSIESWRKSIGRTLSDFEQIIEEAAYERSLKEDPDIAEKFWSDYSPSEEKIFNGNYYDIQTEIMDAVYLNDSDWLRIVKIFEEVRTDVLTVIDKMVFAPETKHIMKEKINSVRISLPYVDPRKAGSYEGCAKYSNNAHYNVLQNSFYFCMGAINISHNEGSFYGVIAHEISHSIDPKTFSQDIFQQTPLSRLVGQLYKSNASLSCEDWEKQKTDVFVLPSEIYQLPEGLAAMDQCLVDRQHLNKLDHSSLDYVSQRIAESFINSYAGSHRFSYLTTPETFKDGALTNNEFYMEPKLFAEAENGYFENEYFLSGYFHIASAFIQEYKCRLPQPNITEEQAFAEALEETKRLNTIYEYYYLSILGENVLALVPFNLSKPSGEEFADWIAYKVMELKLQRIQSLENKRNFIFSGTSRYCSPRGLESIAKHKTLIEKTYSRNFHSPDRDRRLKHFTPKTAEFLQCVRGEDIKKLDKNCNFLIDSP